MYITRHSRAQTKNRMNPAISQKTVGSVGILSIIAEATEFPMASLSRLPRDSPVPSVATRSRMKAALRMPARRGIQYIGTAS